MPNPDRIPKGGRNVKRGVTHRSRTQTMRPVRVRRARERHIKNARRSCGEKFANELIKYYSRFPNPGPKVKHRKE